jgi:antitoxin component YwqK of YwqJK toxin-antitoxin module
VSQPTFQVTDQNDEQHGEQGYIRTKATLLRVDRLLTITGFLYDRDGRLIQRSYYHEGKLEGPVLRYDEEGFVIRRLSCKHDLVDGEAIVEAPEDESRPEKMRLGAHSGTLGQQA